MKKIGIYGGTFDPIHHAHLILAREAREMLALEKIIFVPAAISPGKDSPVASAAMRLSMLRAAIGNEIGFIVDDCELHRPPPSYTIDTTEEIRRREVDSEIYYLIGEDNLSGLPGWHRFEQLQEMVRFVVLDRTGTQTNHQRVALGRSIRYLVPPAVEEIIRRSNLYRELEK